MYLTFVDFCDQLFNKKILNKKVTRSAQEYIKEFKKAYPDEPCPKKSWVYYMAKSVHYKFSLKWLPTKKKEKLYLKSDDERKKPEKYNSIEDRPTKEELRVAPGNFEIDSVIGKRTDKQALLTLIDIHNGNFYSAFYNRTMIDFKDVLKALIDENNQEIKTLTMDNGGENNMLHEIISRDKMFNCHPYCSREKGTLENKHRIVRRVIPKGKSLDFYTNEDLVILNQFVNNYYSEIFQRV